MDGCDRGGERWLCAVCVETVERDGCVVVVKKEECTGGVEKKSCVAGIREGWVWGRGGQRWMNNLSEES